MDDIESADLTFFAAIREGWEARAIEAQSPGARPTLDRLENGPTLAS